MKTPTEKIFLYKQLPERICSWYAENKRILPWREEKDPYKIWVSEIMLQQTRVEAVRPYYERFLKELPDIGALAACPEEKLLKLWEGLGYYSRVRNMQKAAKILAASGQNPPGDPKSRAGRRQDQVSLPRDPEELLALPGIGSYTAGAIASIAYGVPVPAVDGNVLRILARITADDTDILKASVRKDAEKLLTAVLKEAAAAPSGTTSVRKETGVTDPGSFNQGMMDLGAGVCLPNTQPLCEKCPLADICEAHRLGRETELPVRKKAKERRVEQRTILIIRDGGRTALTRRQDTGLLAGMYEFPNLPGKQSIKAVLQAVKEQNMEPLRIRKLEPAKHLFSHVEWQMTGYEIRVAGFPEAMRNTETTQNAEEPRTGQWFLAEIRQIEKEYPIPSAYKAYARHLQMKLGKDHRKDQEHI